MTQSKQLTESEIIFILNTNDDIKENVDLMLDGNKNYIMMSVISDKLLSINFAGYIYNKLDILQYKLKCRTFLTSNNITPIDITDRSIGSTHGFFITVDPIELAQLRTIQALKDSAIRSDK